MITEKKNLQLNIGKNLPLVFEKKKNKSVIKTLKYINNDLGKTKHYPAGAQEWYNSIYTYNKNYVKSLPVLDKSLRILLKNYCNMWPKQRTFKKRPNLLMKYIDKNRRKLTWKERRLLIRSNPIKPIKLYKRSKIRNKSIKKIYVGKGNLKHTNNKVIVTLFTYNIPKFFLLRNIRKLILSFFSPRRDEYLYSRDILKIKNGREEEIRKKKVFRIGGIKAIKWVKVKVLMEDASAKESFTTLGRASLISKNVIPKKIFSIKIKDIKEKEYIESEYKPVLKPKRLVKIITRIISKASEDKNKVTEVVNKNRNKYKNKVTEVVKNKIKYKRILFYNRRLTLYEYLSSSFKVFSTHYFEDPYKPYPKLDDQEKDFSENFIPMDMIDRVERLNNIKNPPLFLTSSYYNLLCFTILKIKKTTLKLKVMIKYYEYLTKLVKIKVLDNKEKLLFFTNMANKFNVYKYRNTPRYVFTKLKEKKLYLASLLRFVWLLFINDVKFNNPLLVSKLKYLVNNLYNKEVEFNVIELTKMHLNSDIYTQGVALKLTKRENKLYWVLKKSLEKAGLRLPNEDRLSEKFSSFNKHQYLANKIRNTYINSMFENTFRFNNADSLNNLLLGLFPRVKDLTIDVKDRRRLRSITSMPVLFKDYVLYNLKHLNLGGIRVEAKGRLTKRLIAERAVFKMRYIGGLKNIDSSFKGLPAVMLRGFVKSNVESSFISSKNRIGAYGIKGWAGNF